MTDPVELISEYLDGCITPARFDALQHWMRDDPQARRRLLTRVVIDQHLREPVNALDTLDDAVAWRIRDEEASAGSFRGFRGRWLGAAALAAMVCIAGVIGLFLTMRPPASAPVYRQQSASVAMLTDTENAVFSEDISRMQLGGELRPGPIRLVSGTAQLMFNSTAVVDLVGPCEFEIVGSNRGQLHRGKVRAFVPGRAVGFTVATPHASVVDLGTAFNVNVDEQADQTFVRVIEGHVAVIDLNGARQSYWGGDEISLGDQGVMAVHRDMTIVDVRANSGRAYTIVPQALAEDVQAHTDRHYEWNGVSETGMPEALRGADYVMTAMADKVNHQLQVEVTISRPAVLYVFISAMGPAPAWLTERGFTKTGWQIGLDNVDNAHGKALGVGPGRSIDLIYNVWSRTMTQAGRVTLGPAQLQNHDKVGTYGIAATPLPEPADLSKPMRIQTPESKENPS